MADLTYVLVLEAPFKNLDLTLVQVLMLEQDPDLHLPFVEERADFEEVVVEDLLQVVRLNREQLGQCLLASLFLATVVRDHELDLALEDFSEELPARLTHSNHCHALFRPLLQENWPARVNLALQLDSSAPSDHEPRKCLSGPLLLDIPSQAVIQHQAVTHTSLGSDFELRAAHRAQCTDKRLYLTGTPIPEFLDADDFTPLLELAVDLPNDLVEVRVDEQERHLPAVPDAFGHFSLFFRSEAAQEVPLVQ